MEIRKRSLAEEDSHVSSRGRGRGHVRVLYRSSVQACRPASTVMRKCRVEFYFQDRPRRRVRSGTGTYKQACCRCGYARTKKENGARPKAGRRRGALGALCEQQGLLSGVYGAGLFATYSVSSASGANAPWPPATTSAPGAESWIAARSSAAYARFNATPPLPGL